MQLLITTQTQENYGAHDWDGEGACPQYWKFKGGMDYKYDLGRYEIGRASCRERV